MPIDPRELMRPEPRELVNPATVDLNVKAAEIKEINALSKREFLKTIGWGLKIGIPVILAILAYVKREGVVEAIDNLRSRFEEEKPEEKPIDPRVIQVFGETYPEEVVLNGNGQYSLYLLGNPDDGYDLTNIPEPKEKDNIVWYITQQYGITWPFVTQERDKGLLDPALFTIADKQLFIKNISEDLGLSMEQKNDLNLRYEGLSKDPMAVLQWLRDLQRQGVEKITDKVIEYYTDPVTFVTGISQ